MGIIYKIMNFQRVLNNLNETRRELANVQSEYDDYKLSKDVECNDLSDRVFELLNENSQLKNLKFSTEELRKEIKSLKCSKGGFTKKINILNKTNNELKNQIKDLEFKLKESMTDKFLRRELKPVKAKPQKIRPVKVIKPAVARYMADKHDY